MRVTKLLLVSVWSAFGLSDVKPNQSNHNGPSAKKENTQNSQWELKVKKANRLKRGKARENAGDQVVIDFSFASYWLRESRKLFGPITERSKAKPMQSRKNLDPLFKIAWTSV